MLKIVWFIENLCWKYRLSKKQEPKQAGFEDALLNTIIHSQLAFEGMDMLRGYQNLFNQAERNKLKGTLILLNEKLNLAYGSMSKENVERNKKVLSDKVKLYGQLDNISTENQIQLIFELFKSNGK
jgi:hypothetical protein